MSTYYYVDLPRKQVTWKNNILNVRQQTLCCLIMSKRNYYALLIQLQFN